MPKDEWWSGPIIKREIWTAIRKISTSRAPDRLSFSYKYFEDEPLLPLQKIMNFILDNRYWTIKQEHI